MGAWLSNPPIFFFYFFLFFFSLGSFCTICFGNFQLLLIVNVLSLFVCVLVSRLVFFLDVRLPGKVLLGGGLL